MRTLLTLAPTMTLLLGIWQFYQYNQDLKVERSLNLNYRFLEHTSYQAIQNISFGEKEKNEIQTLRKNYKDPQTANEEIKQYLIRYFIERESDWARLYDFYLTTYQCLENELCNRAGLSYSITSSAKKFFENSHYYICAIFLTKNDQYDIAMLRKTKNYFSSRNLECF